VPALSFDALFKSIQKGEIPGAIYLHGVEDVLKEELIAAVSERVLDPSTRDFNFDIRSAATLDPDDVNALCSTLPMMSERRLVVIRDVESWTKRAKAKAAVLAFLERPAPETIVILVQSGSSPEPDAELESRTTSAVADGLAPERAKKWLLMHAARQRVELEEAAASHLVKATGGDLASLRTELEKLSGLVDSAPITVERVAALLGVRHGETQYDWRDLVLAGDKGRAAALLPHLLSQTGVSGVGLVSLLGTSLAGLGLARAHYDRGARGPALVKEIKSSLFRARPARISFDRAAAEWSRLVPSWPLPRVEAALHAALRADERLKTTALSDQRSILFDLLMELSELCQAAA
jgi:DNA polymerase III subunit delta